MKWSKWLIVGLSALVLLLALACTLTSETQYSNPPSTLRDSDLVGTWEAHYMEWGSDKLILRTDGTFKQVYQDHTVKGYVYETPWNEWWVERFPDGRVWVHLRGARFYAAGIRIAELEGMSGSCPENQPDCFWGKMPWSFYDPIADESLYMVGKLVLNVQSDASGNLVLLHMLLSRDEGFENVFTGKAIGFSRIETRSP